MDTAVVYVHRKFLYIPSGLILASVDADSFLLFWASFFRLQQKKQILEVIEDNFIRWGEKEKGLDNLPNVCVQPGEGACVSPSERIQYCRPELCWSWCLSALIPVGLSY